MSKQDNQQDNAIRSAQELRNKHDEALLELNPFLITRDIVDVETDDVGNGKETTVYVRTDDNRLLPIRYRATINSMLVTSYEVLLDDKIWYSFDSQRGNEKEVRWFLAATINLAEQRTDKEMRSYEDQKKVTADLAHQVFAGGLV